MRGNLFSKVELAVLFAALVAIMTAACIPRFAYAATPFTVKFDFDTCTPMLAEGQNIPLNQTKGEVSAYFNSSSLYGPNAFYVASYSTTFAQLSSFQSKYLYPKTNYRDSLDIMFNMPITSINFTFATVEYHGGATVEPSNVTLTAYMDSTATTPVGTTRARGTWPTGDYWPQGTLEFNSTQPFNLVRIELPYQGANAASAFLIDNVIASGPNVIPEFPTSSILILSILTATPAILIANRKLKHAKNISQSPQGSS